MKSLLSDGLRLEPPYSNYYISSSQMSSLPVGSLSAYKGGTVTPGGTWNHLYRTYDYNLEGGVWTLKTGQSTISGHNDYGGLVIRVV